MSFPHQLALVVKIDNLTFESMLIIINNWISNRVISTYIDGLIMAKAYFISMMCYAVFIILCNFLINWH